MLVIKSPAYKASLPVECFFLFWTQSCLEKGTHVFRRKKEDFSPAKITFSFFMSAEQKTQAPRSAFCVLSVPEFLTESRHKCEHVPLTNNCLLFLADAVCVWQIYNFGNVGLIFGIPQPLPV